MQKSQSFRGIIMSVGEEVRTKSNGKDFITCRVKFTEGSLENKVYFANRTLGDEKTEVSVGQEITAYLTLAKDSEGKDRPFFEISTSSVDSADEIMSALGL